MSYLLHRTACDVLEEMRSCYKTRNFASSLGLVEELQGMFSRMESKLSTIKDYKWLQKEIKRLTKKKKDLQNKVGEETSRWD